MSTPQTQWIILSMVFLVLAAVFGTLWFITNQNYTTLLASYNTLKAQYDNLQTQCNTLQAELNNLQSQYSSCETQLNNLQAQNTQLKQELQGCGLTTTLSCVFSSPVQVPAGTQGEQITITLTISNGAFTGASVNGQSGTCSGSQTAAVGIQYSGYITTVNGQTYPFTVTASS